MQEAAPEREWSPGVVEALSHLQNGAPPEVGQVRTFFGWGVLSPFFLNGFVFARFLMFLDG